MPKPRKAQHGGKRAGAGRPPKGAVRVRELPSVTVRLADEERALFDRLHAALELLHGRLSQGDVVAFALRALERELREPGKREGPSVAREVHHG